MEKLKTSSQAASNLYMLAAGVDKLSQVGSLTKAVNGLKNIVPSIQSLQTADVSGVSEKIRTLAEALEPLGNVKLSGFSSAMKSLKDLPDTTKNLSPEVLSAFADKITRISEAVTPLSTKMTTVAQGFKAINGPIRQATTSTEDFGKAINNINLAAILNIAEKGLQIGTKITKTVLSLTEEVIDLDGIVERFTRGFQSGTQGAYEWITRLNKEMGINTQQFMQYTSIFAQMLEGLGVTVKDSSQMAIGYSELTYDIWAAYNDIFKSYEDAVSAVQSAIAGQTRPLRRAGFSVLNTTLQQTAANHGLEISITKATEAEKSYLRYLSLVDQAQAQGIIGTYAKEMNTAEGQLRTLGQMFKSLTQEAGNLLLPLLTVVVPRVQAAVKLITEAIQRLAALFGVSLKAPTWEGTGGFTEAVEGAEEAAEGIESAMGGAAGSAKELKKTLLGIDEINQLNGANKSSGGGGGGGGSSATSAGAGYDWDVSSIWTDAIFQNINNQVDEIVAKFKDMIPTLEWIAAGIGGLSLATLLIDADKLKTVFSTIGAVLLDIGLNVAFTEVTLRADLSTNPAEAVLGLLGEWVASAGAGIMLAKTLGLTNKQGIAIGFIIGAATQITITAIEVAKGDVELFSGNWWIQQLSSLAMGGVAGFLFGGSTGLIIGLGVTLAIEVISTLIAWDNGGAGHKGLKEAFGEGLGLTDDEIYAYAANVIIVPQKVTIGGEGVSQANAVEMLAKVKINLDQAKSDIQSSMLALEQDLTKLRLGIEVNPSTLSSDVSRYINAVQSYIDNTYQEGAISLSLLGMEDSNLQSFLDDWYSDDRLSRLTELINEVANEGTISLSNGFKMEIDPSQKAYVIADLQKQIQEIVDEAAQLRYEAQLTGLELRTSGQLGGEELVKAIEDAVGILSERQLALDQSMDTDILIAKQAYLKALEEGLITPEEAEKIYNDNLSQIFSGWATKSIELTQQILSFGLGKINEGFSEDMKTLQENITTYASNAAGDTFGDMYSSMYTQMMSIGSGISKKAKDAIKMIVEAMLPTVEQQQRIVSEMTAAGQSVDQSLIDGINDAQKLAALVGDVNGIHYMVGWQMTQSPSFIDLLSKTQDAFAGIPQAGKDGISNNIQVVVDEATGLVNITANGITTTLDEVTPELKENLAAIGILIPESIATGASGAMSGLTGQEGPLWKVPTQVTHTLEERIKPEDYKTFGQKIIEGIKSGMQTDKTTFTPTAQNAYNMIIQALQGNTLQNEGYNKGQSFTNGFKAGLSDGAGSAQSTAQQVVNGIKVDGSEGYRNMYSVGEYWLDGIVKGMIDKSNSYDTRQGLRQVTDNTLKVVKNVSYVRSPSKLFADEIGYWWTAGIVEGMNQPDALIDPIKTMYTNAKDWWADNTMDIAGGDFEFTDESGKNHYMDIKDANNEQNSLLREQNALLRAILEKESSGGYYTTTGDAMLEAASHLNRRTGKTMIPVGV